MPQLLGMSRLQRAWQSGLKAIDLDRSGKPEITTGLEQYRAQLPPQIASIKILGNLTDETGADYRGANGRSSMVGGNVYFALNKDPIDAGVSNAATGFPHNSVAIVTDPENNPLGMDTSVRDPDGVARPIMPLINIERKHINDFGDSLLLYLSGGMCESNSGSGHAYVWCERWMRGQHNKGATKEVYVGTALGIVKLDSKTGSIVGKRLCLREIIFDRDEPSFGTFCAVEDENCFYTFGKQGEHVYLARVAKWTPTQPELYETWDGYQFSEYRRRIAPIFSGYSHGTVFRTRMFGNSYKWAFIGLSERGERTVDIGLATNIWGPYKMSEIMNPRMLPPNHEMTRSLFVHTWAFKEEQGQVMITWNDGNTGKIVGAKLQFAMRECRQ